MTAVRRLLTSIAATLSILAVTGSGTPVRVSAANWDRLDILCLDQACEKTLCFQDGEQACTPQYCTSQCMHV